MNTPKKGDRFLIINHDDYLHTINRGIGDVITIINVGSGRKDEDKYHAYFYGGVLYLPKDLKWVKELGPSRTVVDILNDKI